MDSISLILCNMNSLNLIKREDNEMAVFNGSNGSGLRIEMRREPIFLFRNDMIAKFKCFFSFKDMFNNEIYRVSNSEYFVLNFLVELEEYIDFEYNNKFEFSVAGDFKDSNNCINIFKFIRDPNDYQHHIFTIDEYNPLIEQITTRIKFEFFNDTELEKFIEIIYFTFIFDIDENDYFY
jgi:hypothetical protein